MIEVAKIVGQVYGVEGEEICNHCAHSFVSGQSALTTRLPCIYAYASIRVRWRNQF